MSRLLIVLLRLYQCGSRLTPPVCRFHPSCSQYMIEAIQKYGPLPGIWRGVRRLFRCHPFHPGGYDPVCSPPAADAPRGVSAAPTRLKVK